MVGLFLYLGSLTGQSTYDAPEFQMDREEIEVQLHFLASDHLAGRRTGSPGNDIAAHYIAAHLEAYGYQPPEGHGSYFQKIPFQASEAPAQFGMNINKKDLQPTEDFLIMSGPAKEIRKAKGIFAGHGWVDAESDHDDYAGLDVEGKVVFVLPGPPGNKNPMATFEAIPTKQKLAAERGAVALIELYQLPFPWTMFANFAGGETMRVDDNEEEESPDLVYGWMNNNDAISFEDIQANEKMRIALNSTGYQERRLYSNNVIGVLEGTDPDLKNEYLLLTAHFDHVGVGEQGGQYTEQDSIFNGARDNAFGTVALLQAAKALSEDRPKRSVIILAVTGEELGLLGSAYYAENPLVPLEQTIFNLNTDGAGYNTTDAISIFGWSRTGTNDHVEMGLSPFGLDVIGDPAPEQGLFDRSDNVSFAKKGIPALTFSPGFNEFDAEILKNYHQVTDEASTLDFAYVKKFCQAYARTARLIANDPARPIWVEGDKYEEAGKQLYGVDKP